MPLDPRTRFLLQQYTQNNNSNVFQTEHCDSVSFSAIISDVNEWNRLTEIEQGVIIKLNEKDRGKEGLYLVTGSGNPSKINTIGQKDYIYQLQLARGVTPCKITMQQELEIDVGDRYFKSFGMSSDVIRGNGVVVGIVDVGGDFAHKSFLNDDGSSRFEYIWDQRVKHKPPNDEFIKYGFVYRKEDFDRVLLDSSIYAKYKTLGYDPGDNSHGTHVMDIAVGSDKIASKASIIFVHLGEVEEQKLFANSVQVIEAISFIFEKAGDRPCVINLSIGNSSGPHNGKNDVELAIDTLVSDKRNRAVVLSAGNFYDKKMHKSGYVKKNETTLISWEMKSNEVYSDECSYDLLEIWYSGNDEFNLDISSALFNYNNVVLNGSDLEILDKRKNILGFVSHSSDCEDNHILIARKVCAKNKGIWNMELTGKVITETKGAYHAYIEVLGLKKTSNLLDATPDCTLGSISSGEKSIVVSAYKLNTQRIISYFSSSGPTRDGLFKPELCAPGQNIWAANSKSQGKRKESGTSQSAPVITGIIARILSIAYSQGQELSIEDIRNILINSSTLNDFNFDESELKTDTNGRQWHPRYGYGRITFNILQDTISKYIK